MYLIQRGYIQVELINLIGNLCLIAFNRLKIRSNLKATTYHMSSQVELKQTHPIKSNAYLTQQKFKMVDSQ